MLSILSGCLGLSRQLDVPGDPSDASVSAFLLHFTFLSLSFPLLLPLPLPLYIFTFPLSWCAQFMSRWGRFDWSQQHHHLSPETLWLWLTAGKTLSFFISFNNSYFQLLQLFLSCRILLLLLPPLLLFLDVIVVCSPSVYFGSKFCRLARRRQLPFWWCQAEAASSPRTHTDSLSHTTTLTGRGVGEAKINVAFRIFTPFSRGTPSLSLKSFVCFRQLFRRYICTPQFNTLTHTRTYTLA